MPGLAQASCQLTRVRDANSRSAKGWPRNRTKYSYDAAGHVLAYTGLSLSYDDAGRLVSASNGSTTTTYKYDALGQRIAKSSGATTTYFAYDIFGHLLGEYDGTGALIQEIVWMEDTPVVSVRPTPCGLGIFYIHTDHLNTPKRITRRSTADIVWRWDSDPFGDTAPNQNPSGLGTFTFNLRFPGQYYDVETGLNYNYFRHYDSLAGRYVESDLIGLKGRSLSTYAYVLNNPVRNIDGNGLEIICGSYYCGTTIPAYPGAPGYTEPAPSPCEICQGGDKLEIRINATVCGPNDMSCFLAMQAAGIPGPYTPHTNYYSKTCLSTLALKLKAAGVVAGEGAKNGAPSAARALGLSSKVVTGLSEFLEYTMGWGAFAVLSPFAIIHLGDRCQCNK